MSLLDAIFYHNKKGEKLHRETSERFPPYQSEWAISSLQTTLSIISLLAFKDPGSAESTN